MPTASFDVAWALVAALLFLAHCNAVRAYPYAELLSNDLTLGQLLGDILGSPPRLPPLDATLSPSNTANTDEDWTEPTSSSTPTPQPNIVGAAQPDAADEPVPTGHWNSPVQYSDLTSFGVHKFAYGADNMAFVSGALPLTAPVRQLVGGLLDSILEDGGGDMESWPAPNSSTTLIQLKYPAGSINPGSHAVRGGAGFYSLPVPVAGALPHATKTTFAYSVYFPPDFDWVKGGKLPGLYGGHETCSGGNDAMSCFSTRLMWRPNGEGELYLYAPRDRQSSSVCSTAPVSLCDTSYGMSIGRGAFSFPRGGWTRVSQTVSLNTPGTADGSFTLNVNGRTALNVDGVYYRNPPANVAIPSPTPNVSGQAALREAVDPQKDQPRRRQLAVPSSMTTAQAPKWTPPIIVFDDPSRDPSRAIGFAGMFFSSFFGGHEPEYATPRDQYVYFADFELSVNP
ncbi:hypothetical protein BKA62DRAFT_215197 [Auriculariales sp. MPI-PUGE-AT-0066]|nr:hypothetical protein BKA62DRAFT_215197 [Auriculariales sp. MPI-PUGE-AT-0066]